MENHQRLLCILIFTSTRIYGLAESQQIQDLRVGPGLLYLSLILPVSNWLGQHSWGQGQKHGEQAPFQLFDNNTSATILLANARFWPRLAPMWEEINSPLMEGTAKLHGVELACRKRWQFVANSSTYHSFLFQYQNAVIPAISWYHHLSVLLMDRNRTWIHFKNFICT